MSVLYPVHINDSSIHQIHRPSLNIRERSPQNIRQELISKIKALANKNIQLEVKQESLQNTVLFFTKDEVYDLKKLIELTNNEGEQTMSYIHKQIESMESKKDRYTAGLYYGQKNDKHFQKCMLFWNEFM